MKNFLKSHKFSLCLYAISCASICLMLTAFGFIINIDNSFSKIDFARNIGDAILLTSIFWILPQRKRWLIILPVTFVSIFSLINIWYFRFWNDILPVSCLTMTENVNALLFNSILGLLSLSDLIFVLPIALNIYAYTYCRKLSNDRFSNRTKFCGVILSLSCFLTSQAAMSESGRRWQFNEFNTKQTLLSVTKQRITVQPHRSTTYYNNNGLIVHTGRMISMIFELKHMSKNLSAMEINEISNYVNLNRQYFNSETFSSNKTKNIILIITESLNADVINRKINNREVTPTLNSLLDANGTVATTSLISQIKEGISGDGQMIYNSGILPLEVGATPLHVIHKTKLHPLSDLLSRNTIAAVFSGSATAWKERQNFEKYGFPCISSSVESMSEIPHIGHDAAMFNRGQNLLLHAQEPFFIEFITESMHIPFHDEGVSGYDWIYNDSSLASEEANYLRMCTYFDYQLNCFIDFLKQRNLYDNTILIIASDHSQNLATPSSSRKPDSEIPIVFIATNTGISKHITKPVGQIDVFPTILQIAGVENPKFAGVGTSMLDSTRVTNMEAAQNISELILRGNYFGTVKD